jgi:cyanosortase A-associated protein
MLIKSNNPLPIPPKSFSFRDQNFLFLVILGLIFAIYLTIIWRFYKNFNAIFIEGIMYFCFLFRLSQKQDKIYFSSSFWPRITGVILTFVPLIRSITLFLQEDIFVSRPSLVSFVVISVLGYIIFITGFKGLKQFKKELLFFIFIVCLFPLIVSALDYILYSTGQYSHNFLTTFSAKLASFFLYYIGFLPENEGSIIHVNNGTVDVNFACTGWVLFLLLVRFSFCVLFVFRSSLKNPLFPFLLSLFISLILSIIRIMIMALVVKEEASFLYWHEGGGVGIFTSVAMISFWGIMFLKLPDSLFLDIEPINFGIRFHPFLLIIFALLSFIFLSSIVFSFLSGEINQTASYTFKFPDQISLANWKTMDNYPSDIISKISKPRGSLDEARGREPSNSTNKILAGQIYHYKNNSNLLTVNAHYIINASGNIKDYYKKFQDLPQLKNTIEKEAKNGFYLYFLKNKQLSLTACVNHKGITTVTSTQFIKAISIFSLNNFINSGYSFLN